MKKTYPIVIMAHSIEEAERNLTAIKALYYKGEMSGAGATSIADAKALMEYVESENIYPTPAPTVGKTNRITMEPRPTKSMSVGEQIVKAMMAEYCHMDKGQPIDQLVDKLMEKVKDIADHACIYTECDGYCSECEAENTNPIVEMFTKLHEALTAEDDTCECEGCGDTDCEDYPMYEDCYPEAEPMVELEQGEYTLDRLYKLIEELENR